MFIVAAKEIMITSTSTQTLYKLIPIHYSLNPKGKYKPYPKYQNMQIVHNMKHY